jgi:hypothetical protein
MMRMDNIRQISRTPELWDAFLDQHWESEFEGKFEKVTASQDDRGKSSRKMIDHSCYSSGLHTLRIDVTPKKAAGLLSLPQLF